MKPLLANAQRAQTSSISRSSNSYSDEALESGNSEFKTIYKRYKKRNPPASLSDVLYPRIGGDAFCNIPVSFEGHSSSSWIKQLGLRSVDQWKCLSLENHEGLYILTDIIEEDRHLEWFKRCLYAYPEGSGKTNVHLHFPDAHEIFNNYRDRLRWTTLGIHYDWDTKLYAEKGDPLPVELVSFGSLISEVLGLGPFHPDAAIINFFPLKGTLGPHIDRSERDLKNPLISLSLGQSAVYLTGGTDLNSPVVPLYLQSGDVLIMHGDQRLVYHAVPSIRITKKFEPSNQISREVLEYANNHRISLTLRQVDSF
ncbi:unnamed protein product [Enterobius vermicularis]|uniref:Fe2OG dioxygenase domain-containing protein n=1 Tax=Enterobius vermicularis TaxID=51028 RepID=A0A0N4UUS5_ENTVE|nr:unnamed protein product [Enterobius vermicularis]